MRFVTMKQDQSLTLGGGGGRGKGGSILRPEDTIVSSTQKRGWSEGMTLIIRGEERSYHESKNKLGQILRHSTIILENS